MLTISVVEMLLMIVVLPLLGGIIGYVVGTDRARRNGDGNKLAELQQEYDDYRMGVSAHFQETAGLMQQMTDQYRSLYSHMAHGAVSLCEVADDNPRLQAFSRLGRELAAEATSGAVDPGAGDARGEG